MKINLTKIVACKGISTKDNAKRASNELSHISERNSKTLDPQLERKALVGAL